mgnify:CR=1 FL=1
MLFPITNEDRSRLKRLARDKASIFALKKLFLNICVEAPASNEAITKITKAFQQLDSIQPEVSKETNKDNLV